MRTVSFLIAAMTLILLYEGPDISAQDLLAGTQGAMIAQAGRNDNENGVKDRRVPDKNIITVFFEDIDAPESRISLGISHQLGLKAVGNYAETKKQKGTYSRNQFNVLLCENQPCEQLWFASFVYTDENRKSDKFSLSWKQTVFAGMTPSGTVKRELLFCVNNNCKNLEDTSDSGRCVQLTPDNHCKSLEASAAADAPLTTMTGRYQLTWRKAALVVRRTDVTP